MLSFDIRSLEAQAATVDELLSADDAVWEEGDPRPDSAVHVTGRLSAAGTGQFYWHGRQLACLCAHAYTDTKEELTMPLLSSKIERPPHLILSGARGCPHYSYCCNTPPPPFNPARLAAMGAGGARGQGPLGRDGPVGHGGDSSGG